MKIKLNELKKIIKEELLTEIGPWWYQNEKGPHGPTEGEPIYGTGTQGSDYFVMIGNQTYSVPKEAYDYFVRLRKDGKGQHITQYDIDWVSRRY